MHLYNTLILHVPHASADFSFAGLNATDPCGRSFLRQATPLIDWYTDELFVPATPSEQIVPVVFDTCRTLVDVERLSHDPLGAEKLGITSSRLLLTSRGYLDPRASEESDSRYLQKYLDHQYRLACLTIRHHRSLLIDCHSFSSGPTVLQPDMMKTRGVDICLGFNEDFTRPDDHTLYLVEEHFLERGYRVSFNTPFSCSKTIDTPAHYKSLMIAVNKRLYMHEKTLEKRESFAKLVGDIQSLYAELLGM